MFVVVVVLSGEDREGSEANFRLYISDNGNDVGSVSQNWKRDDDGAATKKEEEEGCERINCGFPD